MKRLAYTRRAPRAGSSASFSLFPFLAVLICTMGVLILLLVLISQNARERLFATIAAEESVDSKIPERGTTPNIAFNEVTNEAILIDPTDIGLSEGASEEEIVEKLKSEADVFQWLTQETLLSQEDTLEQLDDARARVGIIEKNIATLVKELEQLHEAMRALSEKVQTPATDLANLQKTLQEKQKAKEAAEKELEKIRKKHAHTEQSYAVVPYRGPNGTFRRPIYIECRSDCVIIQPEGIELQAFDFLMPDRRDNPMEMGVRTVRQYLVETQQLQRDSEPYPLFLVRPSGIDAYEAALQSLGSWKGDHGYELIGEDWNLEFHQPSEELKQRLVSQIQIARVRQEGYIQAEIARGAYAQRKKLQFRASSQGGVEQIGGPELRSQQRFAAGRGSGLGNGLGTETNTGSETGTGTESIAGAATNGTAANYFPPGSAPSGSTMSGSTMSGSTSSGQQTPLGTDASMRIASNADMRLPQAFPANQASGNPSQFGDLQGEFSNNFADYGDAPFDLNGTGGDSFERSDDSSNSQLNAAKAGMENTSADPNAAMGIPSLSFEMNSKFVKDKKPKNWGLKDKKPHTNRPVDRIVRIRCDKEQYTIVKQPGLFMNRNILINAPNNTVAASERLVQAIWDYMETWGSAGENNFWRPLLRIQVVPGAEEQFEILKAELAESGIGIEKM